jgi:hypothetical protein
MVRGFSDFDELTFFLRIIHDDDSWKKKNARVQKVCLDICR